MRLTSRLLVAITVMGMLIACSKQKPSPVQLEPHDKAVSPLAAATAPGSVTLTWTQSTSSGVTGNNVYRGIGSCSTVSQVESMAPPATTWTDTSVSPATTYCYYVTAICSSCSPQESVPSQSVNVTTSQPQPAPPTNLTANATTAGVQLEWQPVPGVKAYRVYRHPNSTPPFNQIAAGLTSTSYLDSKAPKGERFYYVEAVSSQGVLSEPSNVVSVMVQ